MMKMLKRLSALFAAGVVLLSNAVILAAAEELPEGFQSPDAIITEAGGLKTVTLQNCDALYMTPQASSKQLDHALEKVSYASGVSLETLNREIKLSSTENVTWTRSGENQQFVLSGSLKASQAADAGNDPSEGENGNVVVTDDGTNGYVYDYSFNITCSNIEMSLVSSISMDITGTEHLSWSVTDKATNEQIDGDSKDRTIDIKKKDMRVETASDGNVYLYINTDSDSDDKYDDLLIKMNVLGVQTAGKNQAVLKDADSKPGEVDGIDIDPEIVTGKKDKDDRSASAAAKAAAAAGGIAVAVAAAAAATRMNKNHIIYKMIIDKDFGDTISPGKPYAIRARIVQINTQTGQRREAPELTAKIAVSSEDLKTSYKLSTLAAAQTCMLAVVKLDRAIDKNTAIVSFRFTGKGGTFTENLRFKVDVKRYIRQLYFSPENKQVRVLNLAQAGERGQSEHVMFLGENVCSDIYLSVHGFYSVPDLTVESADKNLISPAWDFRERLDSSSEDVKQNDFVFRVNLSNLTPKPDYDRKPDVGNAKMNANVSNARTSYLKSEKTKLTATFSNKEGITMTVQIDVLIVPRGFYYDLSQSDERQKSRDYIELYTNELLNQHHAGLRPTFIPIYYSYVQLDKMYGYERVCVTAAEFNNKFEKLEMCFAPVTIYGERIKNQFHLNITSAKQAGRDGLLFTPKLPVIEFEPDMKIMYKLMLCANEQHKGKAEPDFKRGMFLVRIYGEPENSELHSRHKAMAAFEKLMLSYDMQGNTDIIKIQKNLPKMSTKQIEIMVRWLFEKGTELQQKERADAQKADDFYTVGLWFLNTTKYVNDIAFSIVLKTLARKAGLNADMTDAIVTPFKELIEEMISKSYEQVALNDGDFLDSLDTNLIVDKYCKMGEELLFSQLDGALKQFASGSVKGLAKLVSVVLFSSLINIGKHIYLETQKDNELIASGGAPDEPIVWRVIKNVLCDLTANTLKFGLLKFMAHFGSVDAPQQLNRIRQISNIRLNSIATTGRASKRIVEYYIKAHEGIIGTVLRDVSANKVLPDAAKCALDTSLDKAYNLAVKLGKKNEEIYNSLTENAVSVVDSLMEPEIDVNGDIVIKTATNGDIRVPSILVLWDYLENFWNELDIKGSLSSFFRDPPRLPDDFPCQSYKDTVSGLHDCGLDSEVDYLTRHFENPAGNEIASGTVRL